jgi:hypothetical protein
MSTPVLIIGAVVTVVVLLNIWATRAAILQVKETDFGTAPHFGSGRDPHSD